MKESIDDVYIAEDGEHIAFGVPFSKIDVKNRTVEGFATLDNIDKGFDIVDFEASKEAFDNWLGNVREMHGNNAVGRAVTIEQRRYENDGKTHNGIWVKSRISKGAPDTWEKILDGTLQGYSIGGKVLERRPEIVKSDEGRYSSARVNRITKYILAELSLVDNPMNPLAMLETTAKSMLLKVEGSDLVASDVLAERKGIFYCPDCDIAKVEAVDTTDFECLTCDNNMKKIGEVFEVPEKPGLMKMVQDMQKATYAYTPKDGPPKLDISDPRHCAAAVAALGPGGFRGNRVQIPAKDLAAVKSRVAAAYRRFFPGKPLPDVLKGEDIEEDKLEEANMDKVDMYIYSDSDNESGFGYSGDWKPNPEIVDAKPDLVHEVDAPEGAPQTKAAADVADEALAMQTAEGDFPADSDIQIHINASVLDTQRISEKVFEALKSHGKLTGRTRVDKVAPENEVIERERQFVSSLLNNDLYRKSKKPRKGYPTEKEFYADGENLSFPIYDTETVRASVVYFNNPGQREDGGYSMSEWAGIGRDIASAAKTLTGTDFSYVAGKIEGLDKIDCEKGQFIIDLQKNATNDNNDMIMLLHSLVGYLDDSSITKGGETPTLDTKELEKILDILETATKEVGDVLKGFNVQRLNNENGSGPTLGGSDPGDAGVGTADANDGGQAWPAAEVEVAAAASMPTPDNGPEKVVPNAISTDGTGAHEGVTADSGPSKVLPHADLESTSVTTKAEETEEVKVEDKTEELLKAFVTKIEGTFDVLNERLTNVENSGGGKKSIDVEGAELKKSDGAAFWGNTFSADELKRN